MFLCVKNKNIKDKIKEYIDENKLSKILLYGRKKASRKSQIMYKIMNIISIRIKMKTTIIG
ncbi:MULTISPECIES: hypothetical protein [Oceanotoga]|uniref:hypothetical protein n=1 Tax=Oceanotoga TaxID=1255275 RepID=UPI002654A387|nr:MULTISPECIES: hypothetical protein [Oceanotoga]MDN5341534.1 hypothetical protein [Oceanotoga sp.]MDO7977770.1 hypothetical protein [Oceanotoga teriensis]